MCVWVKYFFDSSTPADIFLNLQIFETLAKSNIFLANCWKKHFFTSIMCCANLTDMCIRLTNGALTCNTGYLKRHVVHTMIQWRDLEVKNLLEKKITNVMLIRPKNMNLYYPFPFFFFFFKYLVLVNRDCHNIGRHRIEGAKQLN